MNAAGSDIVIFAAETLPLKEWLQDASRILSAAMGRATPERMTALVADVTADPPRRRLFLACRGGSLVGAMVIRGAEEHSGEIELLAVVPEARGHGTGRLMVAWATDNLGYSELVAETDSESLGFYIRCGFAASSLGELRPGTERFLCRLRS
jgi:GNAT superfamily N-acetyltransferase